MYAPSHRPARLLLPLLAAGALTVAACGTSSTDTATEASTPSPAAADPITVADAWVKASPGPMTGAFGIIANTGDADLTVVSASTSASSMTELHEVVMADGQMVMQPKEGGFDVPAGGEHVLEPGADHIMIMQMDTPVEAGDDVEITLTFDDGSTYTYAAQAREFEGGMESYQPTPMP
jgi:copper(I)-binding protein